MVSGCESATRTTRTAVVSTPMRGTERVLVAGVAVTCASGASAMRALLLRSITEIASSPTSMAMRECGGLALVRSAVAVFLNIPKADDEYIRAGFGVSRQR